MSNTSVDEVVNALENTRVSPTGVSFQSKSLKLNNEEDGKNASESFELHNKIYYILQQKL